MQCGLSVDSVKRMAHYHSKTDSDAEGMVTSEDDMQWYQDMHY